MPDSATHEERAKRNIEFLKSFYPSKKHPDWTVTVCFYTAVHIIERAIYASAGTLKFKRKSITALHSDDLQYPVGRHEKRRLIVIENFSEISRPYTKLYSQSKTARYLKFEIPHERIGPLSIDPLNQIIEWSNNNFGTTFPFDL